MLQADKVYLGTSEKPEYVLLPLANRHGLVTGATGTGKTVTLQVLAQGFSDAGVPVFCADIKGDLSGIAEPGEPKDFLMKRAEQIGFAEEYKFSACPVIFWDLFGIKGHPIRTTASEMGPLLLARLMQLNDVQEGVLTIAFKLADEHGWLLLDLKDLRAMLGYMVENADTIAVTYGNVSKASVGAIQRSLLVLENQGGDGFFAEPALEIADIMRTTVDGRGMVSVLAADKLMSSPLLYATFLLWLMSELFETLPEVGDPEKPRLVFFFDEAHLLFDEAPKPLLDRVEQVVRLIRSKGVGVYFVTQNPLDVPDTVLGQLGNRVQHALRAYTPRDQKAVKVAADTFRPNPAFSTMEVISQLAVGEALVSTLEPKGVPSMVERTLIRPPSSRIGPVTDAERAQIMATSQVAMKYDKTVDRESAFEILGARAAGTDMSPTDPAAASDAPASGGFDVGAILGSVLGTNRRRGERLTATQRVAREVTRTVTNRVAGQVAADVGKSIGGSVGGSIGRAIVRGMLGGILRGG
ncbi:helicase HerA-like C-terminal domain-containing protein [Kaistia algarum]|uniref:helicase HerA-like C-terminal domain-containing protein n=1 Tax=Kaistia algarum TaxID=2083279 RepID=UPI00140213F5|nr:helicase HerA-like C-terminal domain-containing protein [Kaistia algarum]MCX5512191.1 DUF853 domain-containing protein [Kaistia algarum]